MRQQSTGGHQYDDGPEFQDGGKFDGLACCVLCGGAEGSLPTECPGVVMTSEQHDEVYGGRLDYRDGAWQNRPSRCWER